MSKVEMTFTVELSDKAVGILDRLTKVYESDRQEMIQMAVIQGLLFLRRDYWQEVERIALAKERKNKRFVQEFCGRCGSDLSYWTDAPPPTEATYCPLPMPQEVLKAYGFEWDYDSAHIKRVLKFDANGKPKITKKIWQFNPNISYRYNGEVTQ